MAAPNDAGGVKWYEIVTAVVAVLGWATSAVQFMAGRREQRRQRKLAVAPSVTACVAPDQTGNTYLEVHNEGRAVARNIRYSLVIKNPKTGIEGPPREDVIDQLAPGERRQCYGTFDRFDLCRGHIEYQDIENGKHWSRYDASVGDEWQFGTGHLPKQAE